MNLGVERFLILGCVAVLILELPQLVDDLEFGDGYPGVAPAGAALGELALQALESPQLELHPEAALAVVVTHEPAELPATPGL